MIPIYHIYHQDYVTEGKLLDMLRTEEAKLQYTRKEWRQLRMKYRTEHNVPELLQAQLFIDLEDMQDGSNIEFEQKYHYAKVLFNGNFIGSIRNPALDRAYLCQNEYGVFPAISLQEAVERMLMPSFEDREVFRENFMDEDFVMDSSRACAVWDIPESTFRANAAKFPPGTARKFGNKWTVTREGMTALYGKTPTQPREAKRSEYNMPETTTLNMDKRIIEMAIEEAVETGEELLIHRDIIELEDSQLVRQVFITPAGDMRINQQEYAK